MAKKARQDIVKEEVKEEEDVIYDDSYSDETEEDNFLTMDWELGCKKLWKTYSARR